ncbi:MAG: hypothetical protein AAGK09_00860 [Planctomycetota bacterium]
MTTPHSTHPSSSAPTPRRVVAAWLIPCLLLAFGLAVAAIPAAAELVDAELLDARLERRVVRLASVSPDRLTYFNDRRELESTPLDEIVRITPIPGTPRASAAPNPTTDEAHPTPGGLLAAFTVHLTDGQRYANVAWRATNQPGAIALEHPALGAFDLPLDLVVALLPADEASPTPAGDQDAAMTDVVVLVNGDALPGFVESIGLDGVTLLPDDGEPLTIGLDRVASVRLINPTDPEPTDDHRLTLRDGTRLYGRGLSLASGSVLGERGGRLMLDARVPDAGWREVAVPLDDVATLDLAGYRLVPLSALEVEDTTPGEVFGVSWPPEPTAEGWVVHAPTTMAWRLPDGATRVALGATLATDRLPSTAAALADCVVRWTADDVDTPTLLGSRRLIGMADRPSAASPDLAWLTAELPATARTLVVAVDAGANGPIADRVRLDGPGVLVVGSAEARSAY